ncbi:MAG: hypothetical protein LBJ77_02310 [Holosporales bacterium]|jgi:hypothetical protein|nr:hypothetical protein [Holosporales bacterium]
MFVPVPDIPDFPGEMVDSARDAPWSGLLSNALFKNACYLVHYDSVSSSQMDFLDGWVYGYLEEFNAGGWGKDVPSEKVTPRVTWVICGSAWSLGVLGLGYFIGGYKKSKSKICVMKVKGL